VDVCKSSNGREGHFSGTIITTGNYLNFIYCNKRVIFLIYTLIFICMLNISHARFVHMYLT